MKLERHTDLLSQDLERGQWVRIPHHPPSLWMVPLNGRQSGLNPEGTARCGVRFVYQSAFMESSTECSVMVPKTMTCRKA